MKSLSLTNVSKVGEFLLRSDENPNKIKINYLDNISNNLVGSRSSSYGNDLTISSSISITRSIVTSLDFKYSISCISKAFS